MTLYDELVKLFREHQYRPSPDYQVPACSCGWMAMANDMDMNRTHFEHLAALACERAEQVAKQATDDYINHRSEHKWLNDAVIAALGKVKRG